MPTVSVPPSGRRRGHGLASSAHSRCRAGRPFSPVARGHMPSVCWAAPGKVSVPGARVALRASKRPRSTFPVLPHLVGAARCQSGPTTGRLVIRLTPIPRIFRAGHPVSRNDHAKINSEEWGSTRAALRSEYLCGGALRALHSISVAWRVTVSDFRSRKNFSRLCHGIARSSRGAAQ
jgi:hypothetical protein